MSQENVEVVRRVFRPGDPSRFFDLHDEHIEFDIASAPLFPNYAGIIRGKDAVIDYWRRYWGTWDDYVLEPTEIIEAGEDQVVVVA